MKERKGYYGEWGGAFIPEVLHQTFVQLNLAYEEARRDEEFWQQTFNEAYSIFNSLANITSGAPVIPTTSPKFLNKEISAEVSNLGPLNMT